MKNHDCNEEFDITELTCSFFTYTKDEFSKLNISEVFSQWSEDLQENSKSYPLFTDSIFDKNCLNLKTAIDKIGDMDLIYVIPYYFYMSSTYTIDTDIDEDCTINLVPIIGDLFNEKPILYIEKKTERFLLNFQDAIDGTKFSIRFYTGRNLTLDILISDFNSNEFDEFHSKFKL